MPELPALPDSNTVAVALTAVALAVAATAVAVSAFALAYIVKVINEWRAWRK